MPFIYQLVQSASRPRAPEGRATLVVCNLGEKRAANRAIEIAASLVDVSGRSVLLLSEARPKAGDGVGARLESAAIDRLMAYDVLVAIDRNERARLTPRMVSIICNLKVRSLKRINPRGKTNAYLRPANDEARRALFIFPGIFVPPRIGSHQRAFSTVLDLMGDGFEVDIVVKRQGGRLIDRVKHYFALLTNRLETYQADPGVTESRAQADAGSAQADERQQPRVFSGFSFGQRLSNDVNDGARRLIADMLTRSNYHLIVVSFPWMLHILDGLQLKGAKVVCDTHDVISNRHRELSDPEAIDRIGEQESTVEREVLGRCDTVLAISRGDAKLFRSRLGLENVVVHPISYYPAEPTTHWRRVSKPLSFGFIGSDMEANRRALHHVMTEWWPVVEAFSPDSQIFIGGAIALSESLSPYIALRERVNVAGPLEDVGLFFDSIDVMLSPSLVRGGVNVKNVEALLRRRPVITNNLGAKMLLPLIVPTRCETADGLLNLLRKIDRGEPALADALETLFDEAAKYHAKPGRLEWAAPAQREKAAE